ncbi:hypothetical protein XENORESO_003230, partial [Xenotaenia resolanae]
MEKRVVNMKPNQLLLCETQQTTCSECNLRTSCTDLKDHGRLPAALPAVGQLCGGIRTSFPTPHSMPS